MGKTRVAYLAKKPFDEPVMLTTEGVPTTDPSVMWHQPRGALMAFAKHKGSGLAFACELMAGLLSGGGTIQPGHSRDGSIVNNMTAFVIDPAVLTDMDFLKNEMDAMIDYVKSSPAPDPVNNPVLSPGEPERMRHEDRLAHGVEISEGEALAIEKAPKSFRRFGAGKREVKGDQRPSSALSTFAIDSTPARILSTGTVTKERRASLWRGSVA